MTTPRTQKSVRPAPARRERRRFLRLSAKGGAQAAARARSVRIVEPRFVRGYRPGVRGAVSAPELSAPASRPVEMNAAASRRGVRAFFRRVAVGLPAASDASDEGLRTQQAA